MTPLALGIAGHTVTPLEVQAAAAAGMLLAVAAGAMAWLWRRPGWTSGLAAGTALSLLIVVPWSFMANLTIGPSGPLGFTSGDLPGSYARLAAGPTGDSGELATFIIAVTVLCLLLGRRGKRHRAAAGGPAAGHAAPAVTAPGPPVRAHGPSRRAGDGGP